MRDILIMQLEGISDAAARCAEKVKKSGNVTSGSKFADISRFLGNVMYEFEKLSEAKINDWPKAFREEYSIGSGTGKDDDEEEDGPASQRNLN